MIGDPDTPNTVYSDEKKFSRPHQRFGYSCSDVSGEEVPSFRRTELPLAGRKGEGIFTSKFSLEGRPKPQLWYRLCEFAA